MKAKMKKVMLCAVAVMLSNVVAVGISKKAISNGSYLPPVTAPKAGGAPPACPTGGCPNG